MKKNIKKELCVCVYIYIYIYITESLCSTGLCFIGEINVIL